MMSELEKVAIVDENFSFLDKEVFDVKVNYSLLHDVLRWQSAKKRLGTRKTKGISDIKATTRKPYKQKGTGRARHGSLCSPQFRGGAVIFGPVVRSHAFSINKKVRSLALKMALSIKVRSNRLFIVEDENLLDLKALSFGNSKGIASLLLVLDGRSENFRGDDYYINSIAFDAMNPYSIVDCDYLLLTRKSLECLNKRFV